MEIHCGKYRNPQWEVPQCWSAFGTNWFYNERPSVIWNQICYRLRLIISDVGKFGLIRHCDSVDGIGENRVISVGLRWEVL